MFANLTIEEERVIIKKGTEAAFSGKYYDFNKPGIYCCKRCENPLFKSEDKFNSGCGWPSFDDMITKAVKLLPDADGLRTEIQCANCGAHLGHIFKGEGFTSKNRRYCVNSISLKFREECYKDIVLGGGCFWCLESVFQRVPGVIKVTPGYSGGELTNPSYEEVCDGDTGHAEVVKIQYDENKVSLDAILELFFLIHDPTTLNRQGADCGTQYRSVIFYYDSKEKLIIDNWVSEAKSSYQDPIVTEISPLSVFYEAEACHKNYYDTHPNQPYCSIVIAPKIKKAVEKIKSLNS